jgi:four helix bundle protein
MSSSRLPDEFRNRTKAFAANIIRFYCKLPVRREEVRILGRQLLRSGTSVASHVREGSRARTDDEFASKLGVAVQETDESQLWLELLREECGANASLTTPLEAEASELIAIMTAMIQRTRQRHKE